MLCVGPVFLDLVTPVGVADRRGINNKQANKQTNEIIPTGGEYKMGKETEWKEKVWRASILNVARGISEKVMFQQRSA